MQTTAMGLVVKETNVGEADKLITILTDKFGMVQASARGSRNLKSKLFSSTGLFCYSEFTFFTQKGNYYVDDAAIQHNFYGLRNTVEGLAVAAYIAEMICTLQPHRAEEINELLRLSLNSLYLLSEAKVSPRQIKAVFELRAVSEAGYRPDLLACAECAKFEDKNGFWFDAKDGKLYCTYCCEYKCHDANVSLAVVTAMRHSIYSDLKRIFSFSLSEQSLDQFAAITENYVLLQLDRSLKTLDFLHAVL